MSSSSSGSMIALSWVYLRFGDVPLVAGIFFGLKPAVTALALAYGGRADVRLQMDAQNVQVVITDEGPGIPEAELSKVFAPFYRLETSRSRGTGGAGLGLAVARDIARAHGGDVVLANRAVRGLTATLSLPRQA